jgi:hypothetical protein
LSGSVVSTYFPFIVRWRGVERTALPTDLANRFGHRLNAVVRRSLHLVDRERRNQRPHGSTDVVWFQLSSTLCSFNVYVAAILIDEVRRLLDGDEVAILDIEH